MGTDSYTWDFENRLTALSVAGTDTYAYSYGNGVQHWPHKVA